MANAKFWPLIALGALLSGAAVTILLLNMQLGLVRAEKEALQARYDTALEANKVTNETLDTLTAEVKRGNDLVEDNLAATKAQAAHFDDMKAEIINEIPDPSPADPVCPMPAINRALDGLLRPVPEAGNDSPDPVR